MLYKILPFPPPPLASLTDDEWLLRFGFIIEYSLTGVMSYMCIRIGSDVR